MKAAVVLGALATICFVIAAAAMGIAAIQHGGCR